MDKTALKNFAVKARNKLIAEVTQKAYEAGITENKIYDIIAFEGGFKIKDRENGKIFKKYELKQRGELLQRVKEKGFDQVMEEIAYTWFNRFIALRFMEINNYLPTGIRALSSLQPGKKEPDIIQEAFNIDLKLDKDIVFRLQDSGDREDLYKYLLICQCNQLGEIMPAVFEKIEDYTELLLPDNLLSEGSVIMDLVESIEEYDWKIELSSDEKEQLEEKKGEHGIEIIGWLYQYYISEKKDEVFAGLRKNIKITKENIPAATQLFTPAWIVKYMVENSLGRLWLESKTVDGGQLTADSKELREKWKYYLDEAEQEPGVQEQLKNLRNPNLSPEKIKILDPAMGSGHILVYAFDVLYDIYLNAGYSERQIPGLILEKSLYGLEIDDRAGQLAYFALLMKARSKNKRIFDQNIELNLCSIQEAVGSEQWMVDSAGAVDSGETVNSGQLTVGSDGTVGCKKLVVDVKELVGYFVKGVSEETKTGLKEDLEYLLNVFRDAKEYGSILQVEEIDFTALGKRIEELRHSAPENVLELKYRKIILEKVPPLIKQGKIMSQKYDVICTNPPYMGRRNMNPKLAEFLNDKFPDSKNDLFSVFMELARTYLKKNGFMGMINQQSWMFLSGYEKLRETLVSNLTLYNMLHLGPHAFEEIGGAVVQSTAFVLRKNELGNYKGSYIRLVDWNNASEKERKALEAVSNPNVNYQYTACSSKFSKIPGSPIAYWVSGQLRKCFSKGIPLEKLAKPRQGMATSNNDKFLKIWSEVGLNNIGFGKESLENAKESRLRWFPYNKGGSYRKWYGNNEYVVNWYNDGEDLKRHASLLYKNYTRTIKNIKFYFKESITYSFVSSSKFGVRYCPKGFIFDVGGSSVFLSKDETFYLLAFLCSKLTFEFLKILNPTLNYQVGNIKNLPLIKPDDSTRQEIIKLSLNNINLSKTDWDSFEASWDFKSHPFLLAARDQLLTANYSLSTSFKIWSAFAEAQFNQLKANEEELNRIFIDIYGLQDELTPEVEDKDVTVRKADQERDIKSFISYAVGCMFGRYSLDKEGLIFAGGEFSEKYRVSNGHWELNTGDAWVQSAIDIAENAIIPISDGDYFEEDILERFVNFVKMAFGEETLEENINYIAEALGVRASETPRQAIRRYFLSGFYKDHVRIYKKRPIYWLFDSGRKNGFKALIYMHRYDSHTVARVRTDYLHELQRKYEAEIKLLDVLMDSNISNREKTAARKKKETIIKQVQECRLYDQAIAHVAAQRIEIDLDDGVKVNYAKFQGIEIPQGEGRKPLKANLLAKI